MSASIEPEAFGRVAVEAQSMGKPIIASDIGGSKETLEKENLDFYIRLKTQENLQNLNTVDSINLH